MADHTVTAFDADLKQLNDSIVSMTELVERQLNGVIGAQKARDAIAAQSVIDADRSVDDLQRIIDEKVVVIIAKRQPLAVDLRTIIAILRVASDIERMGDLAKNNARRVLATVGQAQQPQIAGNLERLGRLVVAQVVNARKAFQLRDAKLALEVWTRDSEVDNLQTSLFRELLTYMMEDPRNIGACTHLLFCARNLERIGDHATNVAEQVHYIVTGNKLTDRPKGPNISDLSV